VPHRIRRGRGPDKQPFELVQVSRPRKRRRLANLSGTGCVHPSSSEIVRVSCLLPCTPRKSSQVMPKLFCPAKKRPGEKKTQLCTEPQICSLRHNGKHHNEEKPNHMVSGSILRTAMHGTQLCSQVRKNTRGGYPTKSRTTKVRSELSVRPHALPVRPCIGTEKTGKVCDRFGLRKCVSCCNGRSERWICTGKLGELPAFFAPLTLARDSGTCYCLLAYHPLNWLGPDGACGGGRRKLSFFSSSPHPSLGSLTHWRTTGAAPPAGKEAPPPPFSFSAGGKRDAQLALQWPVAETTPLSTRRRTPPASAHADTTAHLSFPPAHH
jgi:hypothetical protein